MDEEKAGLHKPPNLLLPPPKRQHIAKKPAGALQNSWRSTANRNLHSSNGTNFGRSAPSQPQQTNGRGRGRGGFHAGPTPRHVLLGRGVTFETLLEELEKEESYLANIFIF